MTMGTGTTCNCQSGANVFNLPDDDRGALYRGQDYWSSRMRGAQTVNAFNWVELWPACSFSADNSICPSESYATNGWWEPWSHGDGGKRGSYFVKGQTVDNVGAALGGVTVSVFRSSDRLYIASVGSDSGGNYMCPTPYPGVSHFIVAYVTGSPDREGTTVNNIIPTAS